MNVVQTWILSAASLPSEKSYNPLINFLDILAIFSVDKLQNILYILIQNTRPPCRRQTSYNINNWFNKSSGTEFPLPLHLLLDISSFLKRLRIRNIYFPKLFFYG